MSTPDLDQLFSRVRKASRMRERYEFDRFEIHDVFTGGMGMVLEGYDPQLDRKVAIKLWKRSGPQACAALLAEAKTLAKLSHRNIVAVYEPGTWGDRVFFVMEWIAGRDGRAWLRSKPDWQDVRVVFMAAGHGLAAAHDAGIQHCDFKPANVLIGDDGRVVVADFGVADSFGGTLAYMAPERLRGGRGDARSDQFSFCVSLWEALFQVRPFAGARPEQLLAAIEAGELRVPEHASEVPEWLVAVARRGLAADPDDRFADMRALLLALAHVPESVDEVIPVAPAADRAARARSQRRGFGIGVASTTAAFVLALWLQREPADGTAETNASSASSDSDVPDLPDAAEPFELDAVLAKIEAGELEAAFSAWATEHARRLEGPEHERVDADALALGHAFADHAELAASEGRFVEAKRAAELAAACGRMAAADLQQWGASTHLADHLIEQADQYRPPSARMRRTSDSD